MNVDFEGFLADARDKRSYSKAASPCSVDRGLLNHPIPVDLFPLFGEMSTAHIQFRTKVKTHYSRIL